MQTDQREKNQILRPYQVFPAYDVLNQVLADVPAIESVRKRNVIMLSGPPGSGKSHMRDWLLPHFGPTARAVVPSSHLYQIMSFAGLPETHLPYDEFKALPFGRERLIAAADCLRKYDPDVFSKLTTTTQAWKEGRTIIVDNAGFVDELLFYTSVSKKRLLIELNVPHRLRGYESSHAEVKPYHQAAIWGQRWPKDSRYSLVEAGESPLQQHEVTCFFSSEHAINMIESRIFVKKMPGYLRGLSWWHLNQLRLEGLGFIAANHIKENSGKVAR